MLLYSSVLFGDSDASEEACDCALPEERLAPCSFERGLLIPYLFELDVDSVKKQVSFPASKQCPVYATFNKVQRFCPLQTILQIHKNFTIEGIVRVRNRNINTQKHNYDSQKDRFEGNRAHREGDRSRMGLRSRTYNRSPKKPPKPHKQNFIARLVNQWFDRVVGAIKGEGLSSAHEMYATHKTSRDFIWNTAGAASWAIVFPVVTMVSTQLIGVEQAGMISMAFVVAILLMFVGNFGVRTYQISDIQREHSFKDYQVNRLITCIGMLVLGYIYCSFRGYSQEMFDISIAVIMYKFIDALADVYEGRLQQVDKLYLGGISQTIRSLVALILFVVVLVITRNGTAACVAMAIGAVVTFVVVTWPLALLETPKSKPFNAKSCIALFKITAPLFVALFFFNLIENMPKFVMEASLPYDNQLYYNALFFPAQMILISSQLVYKPLLLRMAGVWQESSKRRKFNLLLAGIFLVIAAITAVFSLIMAAIGIPMLNLFYGIDFAQYKGLMFLMLITGGITAAIDFTYQVITIMRRQKDVTVLFVMDFIFAIFIPILLIEYAQLEGAVLSYVIVEAILFVLLIWEYFKIRRDLHGKTIAPEPERTSFANLIELGDPVLGDAEDEDVAQDGGLSYANPGSGASLAVNADEEPTRKLRPSEARAIRQHREDVMRRRTGNRK